MLRTLAATRVAEVQRRAFVRADGDTTLRQAVVRMREAGRGSILILAPDGRLSGIFTQRDLIIRVDLGLKAWGEVRLSRVMTVNPVTVLDTASLSTALARMDKGGFRTLPVVDGKGQVTGVISIRDILRHVAEKFPKEFVNLPPEPDMATSRWGG